MSKHSEKYILSQIVYPDGWNKAAFPCVQLPVRFFRQWQMHCVISMGPVCRTAKRTSGRTFSSAGFARRGRPVCRTGILLTGDFLIKYIPYAYGQPLSRVYSLSDNTSSCDHWADTSKNFLQFLWRHSEISSKCLWALATSSEYRVPSFDAFFYIIFLITGTVSKIPFVQYFEAETLLPSIRAEEALIHQLEMTFLKIFKLSLC